MEHFLRRSALQNERGHRSRTFLILDAASSPEKPLEIMAFFTLAMGMMRISSSISRNKSRRLAGPFYDDDQIVQLTPCYLIGQMGRSATSAGRISGDRILNEAMNEIRNAWDSVGGKFVRLDCEDAPGLLSLYRRNGFEFAQRNQRTGLTEMVRFL
ncbi:MAG: hypothetical protein WCK39_11140 [Methanomassiliicoccales archaeon]